MAQNIDIDSPSDGGDNQVNQESVSEARQRVREHSEHVRYSTATGIGDALVTGGIQDLKYGVSRIASFTKLGLELVPPPNFSLVWKGVYRSSFPKADHFEHLKSLGLRSILTLVPEEYPEANIIFMKENGIKHHQISMPGNKEPFVKIPPQAIKAALGVVLNRHNHPILIHCNKGKHRTGCVVGCLRKLQTWALSSIFQEYRDHADPKARLLDEQFIDLFDERSLVRLARQENWVPNSTEVTHAATEYKSRGDESPVVDIEDEDGRIPHLGV
ncbi:hypothetical protein FGG08_002090 [Glutinoglossum americanum]|uniref:diphosphoinositol-polyphosphate diphosphatase n=1 Tax=Glutinoglossum americanum TaxID=1670608 RepID=A0A9P8I5I3_9PEZI|nr:hypothetical protein FGG08_002090 [Glutinoglossum americanum]